MGRNNIFCNLPLHAAQSPAKGATPQEEVWGHPQCSAHRLLDPETLARSCHHHRRHWHPDFPSGFLLALPRHHLALQILAAAQVVDKVAAGPVAILVVNQEGQLQEGQLHVERAWWSTLRPQSVRYQTQEAQSIATGGRAARQRNLPGVPASAVFAVTVLTVWPPAPVQAHRKADTSLQRKLKSQLVMES